MWSALCWTDICRPPVFSAVGIWRGLSKNTVQRGSLGGSGIFLYHKHGWEISIYYTTVRGFSRLRTMACYRSIHEMDVIFYHSYCLRFRAQSSHAMSSGFWHAQVWLSWRERNRVTEQFSRTEGKVKATTGINLTVQVFSTPLKSIARLRQSASSLVGVRQRYPLINCINSIPFPDHYA